MIWRNTMNKYEKELFKFTPSDAIIILILFEKISIAMVDKSLISSRGVNGIWKNFKRIEDQGCILSRY